MQDDRYEDEPRFFSAPRSQEDVTVRPRSLDDFIGQERVREKLRIYMEAARGRGEPLDHILFYGPPGLGKTTLAGIIAQEMGGQLRTTTGPALERAGDLAAIVSNVEPGDVLFIDEIHRMPAQVEEILYPAMEDFALHIVVGKGPLAKTIGLSLPRFTLCGATTRLGLLTSPLRARFGIVEQLALYTEEELARIVLRAGGVMEIQVLGEAAREIARRARDAPCCPEAFAPRSGRCGGSRNGEHRRGGRRPRYGYARCRRRGAGRGGSPHPANDRRVVRRRPRRPRDDGGGLERGHADDRGHL